MANSLPYDPSDVAQDLSQPLTPIASTLQPTGRLRWRNGVLEQEFNMRHFNPSGLVSHFSTDWRPVPTEE
ncbi:hypothetical protein EOA60_10475 [Mesorhizobium sp. M1A.F.Ca.IN.020.06.1.1]|uniref:hypothetical protein n=1 Tax=unclassified Mesorhizobium TaxID=325217 RepID=UPI000FCA1A7C|nr:MULTISPECIES: hypothetical protein [unclassified Mesorhizobium]RUV82298.1 hypothetical protein EOA51_28940 [Mesorhizobium sp. M1A.F.Ca.IN.020.32.1.1]RUW06783.1 hypothetical protein EOA46_25240 [Mesorhizobium sp. M1A.F.Ca.IN.022.05.2.1]RUW31913.1 hypothetical protein EOA60_10475 [Mesorhizobium sp. M1A.F.Ca.IN.020.06.1.1]RWF75666.1 MAG: hypothetical protein EOQ35_28245 [Mesorhizobium sp.]RWF95454.1 MAG: hypothetical protein EOQ38_26460 [Mesorhizobium sp.]